VRDVRTLSPVRTWLDVSRSRWGAICVGLMAFCVGAAGTATVALRGEPDAVVSAQVDRSPDPAPVAVDTSYAWPSTAITTTTTSATTSSSSPVRPSATPSVLQSPGAPAPTSPPGAAPPPPQVVAAVPATHPTERGLYSYDVVSGTLRRLLDRPTAFDVRGEEVVFGDRLHLLSVPVYGGRTTSVYHVSPTPSFANHGDSFDLTRESIAAVELSPDGRAAVTQVAPGEPGSMILTTRLLSASGAAVVELDGMDYEWSHDGAYLADTNWQETLVFDRSNRVVQTLPPIGLYRGVRWEPGGKALLSASGVGVHRYDLATGRETLLDGVTLPIEVHADGRIVGMNPPSMAPDEFSSSGIGIYDPRSGQARSIVPSGRGATWSVDGTRLAVSDKPVWRPGMGETFPSWFLRVHDVASGALQHTVTPSPHLRIVPPGEGGVPWPPPQWSGSRYVVFNVVRTDETRFEAV
jgi:hypothetical protein